jgi:hypothetical protein
MEPQWRPKKITFIFASCAPSWSSKERETSSSSPRERGRRYSISPSSSQSHRSGGSGAAVPFGGYGVRLLSAHVHDFISVQLFGGDTAFPTKEQEAGLRRLLSNIKELHSSRSGLTSKAALSMPRFNSADWNRPFNEATWRK